MGSAPPHQGRANPCYGFLCGLAPQKSNGPSCRPRRRGEALLGSLSTPPLLLLQHCRKYCLQKAGLPETTPLEKSHLHFKEKEEMELICQAHQPRAFHSCHKSKTLMSQAIDPCTLESTLLFRKLLTRHGTPSITIQGSPSFLHDSTVLPIASDSTDPRTCNHQHLDAVFTG